MVAIENHVHALEYEPLVVILERKDAFAAQDARAFGLHQVLYPRKKLVGIERLIGLQRNRLHVLVVVMLEAAGMVGVMVIMIMVVIVVMIMMMVVIVTVAFKKFRFDVEDTIEIEGVAVQDLVERDFRPLGLMHFGIRIDAANAGLDLVELVGRDQIGLVDQR